jgi:hypothetical protein
MKNSGELRDDYFKLTEVFNVQGPTPEVRNRWLELWQTFMQADTYRLINVEVVGMYAGLGWRIAAIDGNFHQADDYLEHYFQHPNIDKSDSIPQVELSCFRAVSLLYTAQEGAACLLYQALLEHKKSTARRLALIFARSQTYTYCLRCIPNETASKELTELVKRIGLLSGVPSELLELLPFEAKYSELCPILNLSYPREDREYVREAAEVGPW